MLTDEERIIVALVASEGWGSEWVKSLIKPLQLLGLSWQELWAKPNAVGKGLHLPLAKIAAIEKFKRQFSPAAYLEYLAQGQIEVLTLLHPNYPPLLKYIPDYPMVLLAKGRIEALKNPTVAIVGTRKMTSYGERVTSKLASELAGAGLNITSGFMYGVDTVAALAAHETGGETVNFLGYGFECVYPGENRRHFAELLEAGHGFMSEYPPWQHANKLTFPARNRLVAGASLGVIVTEAAVASGTMITARLATDYGREVFAVPGSIFSEFSEGTRALVNLGATLVASGQEVVEELASAVNSLVPESFRLPLRSCRVTPLNGGESSLKLVPSLVTESNALVQKIYQQLTSDSATAESLCIVNETSLGEVLTALSYLELAGVVASNGEYYYLVK